MCPLYRRLKVFKRPLRETSATRLVLTSPGRELISKDTSHGSHQVPPSGRKMLGSPWGDCWAPLPCVGCHPGHMRGDQADIPVWWLDPDSGANPIRPPALTVVLEAGITTSSSVASSTDSRLSPEASRSSCMVPAAALHPSLIAWPPFMGPWVALEQGPPRTHSVHVASSIVWFGRK